MHEFPPDTDVGILQPGDTVYVPDDIGKKNLLVVRGYVKSKERGFDIDTADINDLPVIGTIVDTKRVVGYKLIHGQATKCIWEKLKNPTTK